jgi:membrane protease YdiL (CAAX protease family)
MKRHFPTYAQSIGLILLMIPIGIVPFLIIAVFHYAESAIAIAGIYSVVLSLTIVAGLSARKDFSFSRATFPVSLLIIAFAFLTSFHFVMEPLSSSIPTPEGLSKTILEMIQMPILAFVTLVLLAPLLEELLFRGIILDGYLKNYSPVNSIVISAFLFALIHGNLAQGIGAFMMGVVAGLLYWRTKSLLLCIALHFLNNCMAFLAMLADPESISSEGTLQQLINNDSIYFVIYLTFCLILATTGWYLWVNHVKPVRALLTKKPFIYSEIHKPAQAEQV